MTTGAMTRDQLQPFTMLSRRIDTSRRAGRVQRWQDWQWRPLSGPASSGERALGLTAPLFAAVSSFYGHGGSPNAPRLVLLGEAFAGIDDATRAHCMALVREFDLDFVMTSEREWACYAELPGVSKCQLQRHEGIDAVYSSALELGWPGAPAKSRWRAPLSCFGAGPGFVMEPNERLQRLLGGAALLALRRRLRNRYERGLEGGVVTLGQLNELERSTLCGILGRRVGQGSSMRVNVAEPDAALRHGGLADWLHNALQRLDGPIAHKAVQRANAQQQWECLRANCDEPRLAALISNPKGLGQIKRLAGSDPDQALRLCSAAQRVLGKLPAAALASSHLAADVSGDAHALDRGRPVASRMLAGLRRRSPINVDTIPEAVLSIGPASASVSAMSSCVSSVRDRGAIRCRTIVPPR